MKKETYISISNYINEHNGLALIMNLISKAITYITVLLYAVFLMLAYMYDKQLLYRSILIPAVAFVVVSIYRAHNHSKRPYEVYEFTPALNKDTVGKSFPSRHVFSIFMIACVYLPVYRSVGMCLIFLGILLAVIRVLGGVHFIKDVVAGAAIAVLSSILATFMLGL